MIVSFKKQIICLAFISLNLSQEIPNEFMEFQTYKLLMDVGQNWDKNSTFGLPRFQSISNTDAKNWIRSDSLIIQTRAGIFTENNAIALYGFGHFSFKKHYYIYLYPRIVNDPEAFSRFSGIPRDITRAGFNSGETDLSGIGFQNDWMTLQLGRGRESWGAGNEIHLALSEYSPAYDYGILELDFGRIRGKYIHGFLESTEEHINRYINARAIEWTDRKSLLIGLSETVIYSGEGRPLDIAYLNPISNHLEVELNDRLNLVGADDANAVWQVSIDWLPLKNLRLSWNLLYDEFVLDKIEFENGKENGKAYSGRISYAPLMKKESFLTTYLSLITIGTPTFRHGNGYNNFVQRKMPLGWQYGSDGREIKIGLNYFKRFNFIIKLEAGSRVIGEESIASRPYDAYADYLKGKFPSGTIKEYLFIKSGIQFWSKSNILILGGIDIKKSSNEKVRTSAVIGINIYLPKIIKF